VGQGREALSGVAASRTDAVVESCDDMAAKRPMLRGRTKPARVGTARSVQAVSSRGDSARPTERARRIPGLPAVQPHGFLFVFFFRAKQYNTPLTFNSLHHPSRHHVMPSSPARTRTGGGAHGTHSCEEHVPNFLNPRVSRVGVNTPHAAATGRKTRSCGARGHALWHAHGHPASRHHSRVPHAERPRCCCHLSLLPVIPAPRRAPPPPFPKHRLASLSATARRRARTRHRLVDGSRAGTPPPSPPCTPLATGHPPLNWSGT
jgi:hypothetical protein